MATMYSSRASNTYMSLYKFDQQFIYNNMQYSLWVHINRQVVNILFVIDVNKYFVSRKYIFVGFCDNTIINIIVSIVVFEFIPTDNKYIIECS